MKKIISAVLVLLFVALAGWYYATPYLVLKKLESAYQTGNADLILAHADLNSIRKGLKTQLIDLTEKNIALHAKTEQQKLAAQFALPFVTQIYTQIIDKAVTEEVFREVLKEEKAGNKIRKDDVKIKTNYESLNTFSVTLTPKGINSSYKFVLDRDGMNWKVVYIILPDDFTEKMKSVTKTKLQELKN